MTNWPEESVSTVLANNMPMVLKDLEFACGLMGDKFTDDKAKQLVKELGWFFRERFTNLRYGKFIQILNFGANGEYGIAKSLTMAQINTWIKTALSITKQGPKAFETRPGDVSIEQLRNNLGDVRFKQEYPALYAIYVEKRELKIGMKI